ncbi:MAG: sortase [Candidatus Dormiibacterota bacterium]
MSDPQIRRRRAKRGRRLTPRQLRILSVMAVALLAGVVALVFALRPAPSDPAYVASPPLDLPSSGVPTSTPLPAGISVTVRIIVPAAQINIGVVPGDGIHVPIDLAAHYPGTAQPGAPGNAVYYAHDQRGMFLGLHLLHLGDQVRVILKNGSQLVFRVAALKVVSFNDWSVLAPTAFPELTLLTCVSYTAYEPRYIVIATET